MSKVAFLDFFFFLRSEKSFASASAGAGSPDTGGVVSFYMQGFQRPTTRSDTFSTYEGRWRCSAVNSQRILIEYNSFLFFFLECSVKQRYFRHDLVAYVTCLAAEIDAEAVLLLDSTVISTIPREPTPIRPSTPDHLNRCPYPPTPDYMLRNPI